MEITFKKGIILLAFICFTIGAKAQYSAVPDTARFGVGVDVISPSGGFGEQYKFGAGVSASYDLPITEKFYAFANLGIQDLFPNNGPSNNEYITNVNSSSMISVPLNVGLKYYIIRTFYLQGIVGEGLLLDRSSVYAVNNTSLFYGGGFGLLIKRSNRKSFFDVGIKYQFNQSYFGDTNYGTMFAARVAYSFSLK